MKNNSSNKKGFFKTIGTWLKRLFFGADRVLADELEESLRKQAEAVNDVEDIVSPGKQIVKNFFEKKYAVVALVFVILMFLFVFIAPEFMPHYSDSYTQSLQLNIAPGFNMMKVPKQLEEEGIKEIDGYAGFSVGLSEAGKVYVWGSTQLGTTGLDMKNIPEEILNKKMVHIAAGYDHAIAIGEDGKVYGWGDSSLAQYKYTDEEREDFYSIPLELTKEGALNVDEIKKLECGYQVTAILMNDGTLYLWGNGKACGNMNKILPRIEEGVTFKDIAFTTNYAVAVNMNGRGITTGSKDLFSLVKSNTTGKAININDYLDGRKIESICATSKSICMTLEDGSLCFAGDFGVDWNVELPALADDEDFISIVPGGHHYTALTSKGRVITFGDNTLYQCKMTKAAQETQPEGTKIFAGSFQSYIVDENGKIVTKWGHPGYLFGTDKNGRDIFQRIVSGGKMTMTIGAIAVIISSIIGIIIGCLAGYFGGWVDMILMRVEEIFAAIPFLPFAMILSAIMGTMPFTENMRIVIIMCILGFLSWTGLARLVRGQVLVARENEYVLSAKAMGVKESKIAFKHILPNVISVIIVSLTLDFATCMLTESSLSYLGFGVMAPKPTWGNMLNAANNLTTVTNYWWQWVFTALFLAITTICINTVGDALRDVIDPKSKADR